MIELMVPQPRLPRVDTRGLPPVLARKVSAVCRSLEECNDLVSLFAGLDFSPLEGPLYPVLLMVPGSPTHQQIAGWGLCDIYELRDMAVYVWNVTVERLKKNNGQLVDFDSLREKHGLMRREDVEAAVGEAFDDVIRRQKASPITNPSRQPNYPKVRGKTVFVQPENQSWAKEGVTND